MDRPGGSIRNKLLASTLGVFIVFVIVLYTVATVIVRQKMYASLTEKAEQAMIAFDTNLDRMISEVEVQAHALSLNSDLGRYAERGELPTVLVQIDNAIIIRDVGFLVFDSAARHLFTNAEFRLQAESEFFHDFAQQALARNYPLALMSVGDNICIVTAAAISDECARIHGAIVLVRVLDRTLLDQTRELVQAEVALMNGGDHIMASSLLEQSRLDWLPACRARMTANAPARTDTGDYRLVLPIAGNDYFFRAHTFNDLDRRPLGTIHIALSMKPFQQAFRQTIGILAICVLITLMIITLVIIRLSRQTTGPLLKLAALTREMGRGQPISFDSIRTGDEIEILARSFQRLQTDLEESIRKLMLNQNLTTLGRFATDIVHEIKNPLEGLKLLVSGLKRKIEPDQNVSFYVVEIDQAIQKLDSLIHQTLDFARITQPEKEYIELNPFLNTLVRQCRYRKNIRLSLPINSLVLFADRGQLARIVNNILTNAGEAISEQCTITVAVQHSIDGVSLVISDDGPGIAPELHQKIFDPFFTTKPNGHGLGLSIAYQLATNNELELVFKPLQPTGSSFWIYPKKHDA